MLSTKIITFLCALFHQVLCAGTAPIDLLTDCAFNFLSLSAFYLTSPCRKKELGLWAHFLPTKFFIASIFMLLTSCIGFNIGIIYVKYPLSYLFGVSSMSFCFLLLIFTFFFFLLLIQFSFYPYFLLHFRVVFDYVFIPFLPCVLFQFVFSTRARENSSPRKKCRENPMCSQANLKATTAFKLHLILFLNPLVYPKPLTSWTLPQTTRRVQGADGAAHTESLPYPPLSGCPPPSVYYENPPNSRMSRQQEENYGFSGSHAWI